MNKKIFFTALVIVLLLGYILYIMQGKVQEDLTDAIAPQESKGKCVTKACKEGDMSLLHSACQRGDIAEVKALLKEPKVEVNQLDDQGRTPFFVACESGHSCGNFIWRGIDKLAALFGRYPQYGIGIVELLLETPKVAINHPDKEGRTPFYIACANGHARGSWMGRIVDRVALCFGVASQCGIGVVGLLLKDKRVELNQANQSGKTPFAIACERSDKEVVDLLLHDLRLEVNQADEHRKTPLYLACERGYSKRGIFWRLLDWTVGCFGENPRYSMGVVPLLLESERIEVNKYDEEGKTPLFAACEEGYSDVVDLLLKHKRVIVNLASHSGETPYQAACRKRHSRVVDLLLNKGTKLEGGSSATPFYIACAAGKTGEVAELLKNKRVKIDQPDRYGRTPFDIAYREGREGVIKLLLQDERLPHDRVMYDGATLLHIACQRGYVDEVKDLLARRANLNQFNNANQTPFYIAYKKRDRELMKLFLASEELKVDQPIGDGLTPLCIAAQEGYADAVRSLLSRGAHVNKSNKSGQSPLAIAAAKGYGEVVSLLLAESSVEVNKLDHKGYTPLHIACEKGIPNIVALLLKDDRVGVDIGVDDSGFLGSGWFVNKITPYRLAKDNGHKSILKLFKEIRGIDEQEVASDVSVKWGRSEVSIVNGKPSLKFTI